MQFEVEIRVKRTEESGRVMARSIRQCLEFGDNPDYSLAGEAYSIQETTEDLIRVIRAEMDGSRAKTLGLNSGVPKRVG